MYITITELRARSEESEADTLGGEQLCGARGTTDLHGDACDVAAGWRRRGVVGAERAAVRRISRRVRFGRRGRVRRPRRCGRRMWEERVREAVAACESSRARDLDTLIAEDEVAMAIHDAAAELSERICERRSQQRGA